MTTPHAPSKRALSGLFLGFLLLLVFLGAPQLLIAPKPALHPYFPYITLLDYHLPFFNLAGFHDTVRNWYALDDYIANELVHGRQPLPPLTPETYTSQLHLTGPLAAPSPLPPTEDPFLFDLQINSRGFRGAEVAPKKPPGTLRIVTAGDSLTFGFGIPQGQTWSDRLETTLQAAAPKGTKVEVINAGVISFDSVLGAELIRKKVLPLNPDWIVIGYGFNDYNFNNRSTVLGKNVFNDDYWSAQIRKRQSFAGRLTYGINQLRLVQLTNRTLGDLASRRQKAQVIPPADRLKYQATIRGKHSTSLERYEKNLDDLVAELTTKGIKVLLLQSNLTSPYYEPALHAVQKKHALPLVDFRTLFAAALHTDLPPTDSASPVTVLFRVQLPDALAKRKPEMYVVGDYFSAVEIGATPLNDEGRDGDRVADDGIYSGEIPVAWGTILSFRFTMHDATYQEDPWVEEFDGWRVYHRFETRGHVRQAQNGSAPTLDTPIYTFNDLSDRSYAAFTFKPLMAEICHPNVAGHEVLGEGIGEQMRKALAW